MSIDNPFTDRATNTTGATEIPPAGSHPAVLVGLIDLGTHERFYQGQRQGKARQIYLVWELTSEPCAGLKRNHVLGRQFTRSLNKKAKLRQFIEAWAGRQLGDDEAFDYSKMLGKPCLLTVVHKQSGDYTNANIEAVTNIPKGMPKPQATLPQVMWYIGCGKPLPSENWIPYIFGKSLKDVVEASDEHKDGDTPFDGPTNGDDATDREEAGVGADEAGF